MTSATQDTPKTQMNPTQTHKSPTAKRTPISARARAHREALEALNSAMKHHDAAREQLETQRRSVTAAQCRVAESVTRLQSARDAFERLQGLHEEDEAVLVRQGEAT